MEKLITGIHLPSELCALIENAEEIHTTYSSFSCLSPYLDLSKVKKKVINFIV